MPLTEAEQKELQKLRMQRNALKSILDENKDHKQPIPKNEVMAKIIPDWNKLYDGKGNPGPGDVDKAIKTLASQMEKLEKKLTVAPGDDHFIYKPNNPPEQNKAPVEVPNVRKRLGMGDRPVKVDRNNVNNNIIENNNGNKPVKLKTGDVVGVEKSDGKVSLNRKSFGPKHN